jgi:hypothetical protein
VYDSEIGASKCKLANLVMASIAKEIFPDPTTAQTQKADMFMQIMQISDDMEGFASAMIGSKEAGYTKTIDSFRALPPIIKMLNSPEKEKALIRGIVSKVFSHFKEETPAGPGIPQHQALKFALMILSDKIRESRAVLEDVLRDELLYEKTMDHEERQNILLSIAPPEYSRNELIEWNSDRLQKESQRQPTYVASKHKPGEPYLLALS